MSGFRRGGSAAAAAADAKPAAPAQEYTGRRNKFAAPCVLCGVRVEEEKGRLERNDASGKWEVSHIPPCPQQRPDSIEAEAVDARPGVRHQQSVVNGQVVFDGDYTLDLGDRHRTFRLATQDTEDDFMPGKQIIKFLAGADNEGDYTSFGHIDNNGTLRIWKRHQDNVALVSDARTFWAAPHAENVLQAVRCYRCGHKLTVPASVYNGLGPECAKRGF